MSIWIFFRENLAIISALVTVFTTIVSALIACLFWLWTTNKRANDTDQDISTLKDQNIKHQETVQDLKDRLGNVEVNVDGIAKDIHLIKEWFFKSPKKGF